MASHYRHRRSGSATTPFFGPMEGGEIAVNTANRQLAVGDVLSGQPMAYIAVRYFDVRAKYLMKDFVVYDGALYVALTAVNPGPFNPLQWHRASHHPQDTQDLSNYLLKAGGQMTGPLLLFAEPVDDTEPATKYYVDHSHPPPQTADTVPVTPVGGISATDLQSAIAELDAEKVNRSGDTMTGHLGLPINPAASQAVRKDYVDTANATQNTTITSIQNQVNTKADASAIAPLASAAEFRANSAPNSTLTPGAVWGAANYQYLAYGQQIDMATGFDFYIPGGPIHNPANPKSGQKGVLWLHTNAYNWGTSWKFPNSVKPVWSGGYDIVSYSVYDANTIWCVHLPAMG
jgi:hypothetical protein